MDKMNVENNSIVTESEKLTTGLLSEVSISLTPSLSSRIGSIKSSNYETNGNIDLIWHNLRYIVDNNEFKNNKSKTIELIRNASGKGVSGKVTAFLGPSGAGKTTLIECLAGRRTIGLSGDIYVTGGQRTRIAFCAQRDFHLEELTVSETLLFATRLKNYNKIKILEKKLKSHKEIVTNILKQLELESCSNVRVSTCSGGQRKRLSIGIELVARPNILLLDEPTSGLNSSSCLQCIKLLRQLSRGSKTQPMAIIASLHQPSAQVLNLIDYLYIMSFGGRPIYYGPPLELMDYLNKFNLSCPMFVMPTDFTIEVASGDFGQQLVQRMALNQRENFDYYHSIPTDSTSVSKIVQKTKQELHPFFLHTWLLLLRNNIIIWRQPQLTSMRFFTSIAIALLISFIYKNRIGQSNGCIETSLANFDLMRPTGHTNTNIGYIFFSLLFISLSSKMSTILTFPLEMSVFLKERANGLYSCGTYYIAKSIVDFPYQILFPLIYYGISYFTTYQIIEIWRMFYFFMVNIIIAFISQTVGLLIGAFFCDDFTSAVYAVALVTAPLILFTGFLVPFAEIAQYLHPITYLSWFRFAIEAIIISLYGYDRCQPSLPPPSTPTSMPSAPEMKNFIKLVEYLNENNLMADAIWVLNKNITNQLKEGRSLVMKSFQLKDSQLWVNICCLVAVMFVLRLIAYYVLLWKSNRNT